MALIQCPECGQTISDKAEKCPKCSYPIATAEKNVNAEPEQITTEQTIPITENKKKKNTILSVCITAAAIVFVVGAYFLVGLLGNVTVNEIKLAKWKVTDTTSYGDYFEATVTSEQKKPFVAVIGSYDDEKAFPKLAFLQGGEGKLEIYSSDGDDPSIIFHPIGYYQTKEIKSSDLSIKYKDSDYHDVSFGYDEFTSCRVDIDINVNGNRNGLLLVDIENVTNNETDCSLLVPVINGEGKYTYLASLPYKSRGIDISISPVCFVKSKPITENDYTVDKAFSVKKEEGSYNDYYDGEGVWRFADFSDGIILYTMELTDGGDRAERGEVNYRKAFLHNHEITITSYDSANDGVLMPKYDINLISYMPWTELTKEQ